MLKTFSIAFHLVGHLHHPCTRTFYKLIKFLIKTCKVEARIKAPRFFLGSLDKLLNNWLVFSIPARKGLIYQSFSIIGAHPVGDMMLCQGRHVNLANRL